MFASNAPGKSMDSPCFMTMLKVTQTGTGTANADWFSSIDGPWYSTFLSCKHHPIFSFFHN